MRLNNTSQNPSRSVVCCKLTVITNVHATISCSLLDCLSAVLLQWAGGVYHGLGCESFAQGSTYNGNFHEGRRHGFGVCEYHNGDYYEGEWVMGVRQGLGMQQCTDNSNYAGQYSRGLRHGFGAYSFPNGDRYLGQCDSDVPHGYGTYLFASGQAYEGQWAHGKKHGWCVYTVEDGQQWAGQHPHGHASHTHASHWSSSTRQVLCIETALAVYCLKCRQCLCTRHAYMHCHLWKMQSWALQQILHQLISSHRALPCDT